MCFFSRWVLFYFFNFTSWYAECVLRIPTLETSASFLTLPLSPQHLQYSPGEGSRHLNSPGFTFNLWKLPYTYLRSDTYLRSVNKSKKQTSATCFFIFLLVLPEFILFAVFITLNAFLLDSHRVFISATNHPWPMGPLRAESDLVSSLPSGDSWRKSTCYYCKLQSQCFSL